MIETSLSQARLGKTELGQARTHHTTSSRRLRWLTSAALVFCGTMRQAHALDTTIGGWQVNLDTTLSSSVDLRTSNVDQNFVGSANGGRFVLANADNGTLNYKQGTPVAAIQRITTELQAKRDDYGVFIRATGFYDPINDSYRTDFQKLTRPEVRDIGADLRLLDAYVFARPSIFGHPVDVRVGSQALNWGESTFIQFGINSINPLDVTALRTPGSELRQGFLPIPVLDVKTEISDGLTIEAFWQPIWTRSKLEPAGSFFSTNDSLFDGGTYGNLRNDFADNSRSVFGVNQAAGDVFGASLPRLNDRHPTSMDEFGVALRKNFTSLGDAEIGLYFENYHSRVPFGSYRTGAYNISGLGGFLGGALAEFPNPFTLGLPGAPKAYANKTYTSTTGFFADYPKDIHLLGVSWNFTGPDGIALQGELSSRINQPIQLAASDLALAVNLPAIKQSLGTGAPALKAAYQAALSDPVIQLVGSPTGFGSIIDGWKRYPVIQAQTTATKLFTAIPSLGINQIALVGEIGGDFVANFPNERGIFDAAYSTDVNSAFTQAATVNSATRISTKGFASQFSAAYTIASIIDMPNVLPYGIDMKPTLSLQHDFVGTSPVGVNVFVQNTAAASVGVTFNYLQAWSLGVQYTNHFPVFDGGKFYGLIDRDFASAVLSYEF